MHFFLLYLGMASLYGSQNKTKVTKKIPMIMMHLKLLILKEMTMHPFTLYIILESITKIDLLVSTIFSI